MKTKKSGENLPKDRRYKAILFDLGGVLSLGKKSENMRGVHEHVASALGFSIDHYLDAIDGSYPDAIKGKISGKDAMKKMAKNLDTTPEKLESIYRKYYKRSFRMNNHLYKKILKLKKQGYKVGIISDIWPIAKKIFFYKKYYMDLNLVLASCDVKSRKTHKKIFQIALKKLRVSPGETIFVDNEKWNMPAPRALGIKAIQYKGNKELFEQLKKLGIK